MSLKVNFIGRLGANAETVQGVSTPFVSFRVAVADRVGGENTTIWVTVNADYERYKKIVEFFTKGSVVQVTGNLRCSQYCTKAGTTGIDYKVSADSIEFVNLGKKPTVETAKSNTATEGTSTPSAVPEMTTGGLRKKTVDNVPSAAGADPFATAAASEVSAGDDLPF